MASSPGRWGFLQTWLVFGAYMAVPLGLFWFLDYTGALHDTSLFSALIVAIGYRQILTGELKSITVTGGVSKLWSPFEAWALRVRDHIVTQSKRRSDLLEENLRDSLTRSPEKVNTLAEIAFLKTTNAADRTKLNNDLNAVSAETKPNDVDEEHFQTYKIRRKVDICVDAIRSAIPETWIHVLRKRDLIEPAHRWAFQGHWESKTAVTCAVCLLVLLVFGGGFLFWQFAQDGYYRWRFTKMNATEMDRFRARKYFESRATAVAERRAIEIAANPKGARNGHPDSAEKDLLGPFAKLLLYRDLDRHICEEILSLLVELHAQDSDLIPDLIEALRTEDSDLRLRINRTLTDLRRLDYLEPAKDDPLASWVPSKDETAGDIERWVQKYNEWWASNKAAGERTTQLKNASGSDSPSAIPTGSSQ